MKKRKGIGIIEITVIVLVLLFVFGLFLSFRGWGYPGYGGFHHGPSMFYWGAPETYHSCYRDPRTGQMVGNNCSSASVRGGSVNGSRFSSGGMHGGK